MKLQHEFVEHIPAKLQANVIYVCIPFATATHLCCCGCGHEVVTPLSPTDWQLTFDGESVSLHPSIGNWGLACRSHYWIRQNRVVLAPAWMHQRVEAGRALDRFRKSREMAGGSADSPSSSKAESKTDVAAQSIGLWGRIVRFLRYRR